MIQFFLCALAPLQSLPSAGIACPVSGVRCHVLFVQFMSCLARPKIMSCLSSLCPVYGTTHSECFVPWFLLLRGHP